MEREYLSIQASRLHKSPAAKSAQFLLPFFCFLENQIMPYFLLLNNLRRNNRLLELARIKYFIKQLDNFLCPKRRHAHTGARKSLRHYRSALLKLCSALFKIFSIHLSFQLSFISNRD